MAEIVTEVVRVTTTGEAGSATGSASSGVINGYLLDVHLDYHASAPATTDVTVAYDEPDLGTIVVKSNNATDVMLAPVQQKNQAADGAAIAGEYGLYPVNGKVSVAVAQCDALTNAVVAKLRFLRL